MNKNDLFNAMGEISEDLIAEAEVSSKRVKRVKMSKIVAIAAAFAVVLGVTSFATSNILKSRNMSSSSIPDYRSIPSAERLLKDVGIAPVIAEELDGGYTFKSGTIVKNENIGEEGSVVERFNSLSIKYALGDDIINLDIDSSAYGISMDDTDAAEVYKDAALKYTSYANKLVPGNYQLTEQDKEDEASGKYVFSYGMDEISVSQVQILAWEYEGLNYTLCAIDSSVTEEQLINMAKEIIDLQ